MRMLTCLRAWLTVLLAFACGGVGLPAPPAVSKSSKPAPIPGQPAEQRSAPGPTVAEVANSPPIYVADFVSTAANGVAMNDAGDVTGTSYPDPGCGSFCLPPLETVVWRGGRRIVLPTVPEFSGILVRDINNDGWVAGLAGTPGSIAHAVVWKPVGDSYQAIDLGTLPGTTISEAVGIDNQGRVVGWAMNPDTAQKAAPFLWTEAAGMVDLTDLGFPNEKPLAISPGGAVATQFTWYRLEDPSSVVNMPAPPEGFVIGGEPTAINDAGDQARFLISTGAQRLRYLFRFHHEGTWQQLSTLPASPDVTRAVGSISEARDVTATISTNTGLVAYGPDGLAQRLDDFLSPAYPESAVTFGGTMNTAGQILAQVMIGRSPRLMRLTPAVPCTSGCLKVSTLEIRARFVQDRRAPGQCAPDGNAFNVATVRLTVTSDLGTPLSGVRVSGRFLDDYWTNAPVSGTTNGRGIVTFRHTGPCGVGAIAFLVDNAERDGQALDRTQGILTGYAIPSTGPLSTMDMITSFLQSSVKAVPGLGQAIDALTTGVAPAN